MASPPSSSRHTYRGAPASSSVTPSTAPDSPYRRPGRAGSATGKIASDANDLQQQDMRMAAPASPRASTASTASTTSTAGTAPGARPKPASPGKELRAYLHGMKEGDIRKTLFRTTTGIPAAWTAELQRAMAPSIDFVRGILLAELPALERQVAAPGTDENAVFDPRPWAEVGAKLCDAILAPAFVLMPMAAGMLGEMLRELRTAPGFQAIPREEQAGTEHAALTQLFVLAMLLPQLQSGLQGRQAIAALRVLIYVKAAFGMDSTSRGNEAQAIAGKVAQQHRDDAGQWLLDLQMRAGRAASAAPVTIRWRDSSLDTDPAADKIHGALLDKLFKQTWLSRQDDYEAQLKDGHYFLQLGNGSLQRCKSLTELRRYVGAGHRKTLPELLLHIAGTRLEQYLSEYFIAGQAGAPLGLATGTALKAEVFYVIKRDSKDRIVLHFHGMDRFVRQPEQEKEQEISETLVEDSEALPPVTCLEIRFEIRFYQNEEFRMHAAQLFKMTY